MSLESPPVARPSRKLRADQPGPSEGWRSAAVRPAVMALAAGFVLLGGAALELGPLEAKVGMAIGEPIGPFGRLFGYWEPSVWPGSVAVGQAWAWFEEKGPTHNSVRWPAALAAMAIGLLLARRARMTLGARAGVLTALCWFGSIAAIDRSMGAGIDLIAGLCTVAALDRMLARGSGWTTGAWAAAAFLCGGWPPLAVLTLAMIVLGKAQMRWTWRMTIPVAAAVAGWSAWAIAAAWASSPAEAWASALFLPLTQPSAWGLSLTVLGLGMPWAPFAVLATSRSVREGWPAAGRDPVIGWAKVAGACLIAGTVIPGLSPAALVPALAGLAVLAAAGWDSLWDNQGELPSSIRRRALAITWLIVGLWSIMALAGGGYLAFAVAYYRAVMIAVVVSAACAIAFAVLASSRGDGRWALGAVVAVAVGLKLAHWGYYAPETNYRFGQGPWGRAIGQWVPPRFPIYVTHGWPADLAFATGRRVQRLEHPRLLNYQPGGQAKFVLLLASEYEHWPEDCSKLIKVAEFHDEWDSIRVLARTEGKNPYEMPIPRQVQRDE
ncbi:hypothetical protein TA3x_003249 [Tundrisphaera sp. TA3]|uniref:hypothetical protein n=1 Tax=Tundrisphaera sp. TA3 TaxID=3435775 RepID=UPI003EBCAAAE